MSRAFATLVLFGISIVFFVVGCAPAATPTQSAAPASTLPAAPTTAPAATAAQPTTAPAPATTAPTSAAATAPAAPAQSATPAPGAAASDIVRLVIVPGQSQANYRVREQLARLNLPSDAVGVTKSITGTIVGKMDTTIVSSESKIVVDLSTLQSDQGLRDNFLRQNVLQTSQYRYATFVPTSASGLPTSLPASNQGSFKLVGDLTIRNVTKQVTWDATCQVQANQTQATCHATTNFTFEYFNLTIPSVASVLSISDNIILEVDVTLQRATS